MTRHEFNSSFAPMAKALGVKVNHEQAKYFWDEFQHQDKRDFAAACAFSARGNPGYLPKQVPFFESVVAAKEMRLEGAKAQREQETTQFWSGQRLPEEEYAKGKVAIANIKKMLSRGMRVP